MQQKNKEHGHGLRRWCWAITTLCVIGSITGVIYLCAIQVPPYITGRTAEQEQEIRCLGKYYKLIQGNVIYDFPDKPYMMQRGKKTYLRKKGICGN